MRVYALAALSSLDAFGGGFLVQSLLALWLYQRFGLSMAHTGSIFFWTGARSAFSLMDVPTRSSYVMAIVTPQKRQTGLLRPFRNLSVPSRRRRP